MLLHRAGELPDTSLLLDGTPAPVARQDDLQVALPVGGTVALADGFTLTVRSVTDGAAVVAVTPAGPAPAVAPPAARPGGPCAAGRGYPRRPAPAAAAAPAPAAVPPPGSAPVPVAASGGLPAQTRPAALVSSGHPRCWPPVARCRMRSDRRRGRRPPPPAGAPPLSSGASRCAVPAVARR